MTYYNGQDNCRLLDGVEIVEIITTKRTKSKGLQPKNINLDGRMNYSYSKKLTNQYRTRFTSLPHEEKYIYNMSK